MRGRQREIGRQTDGRTDRQTEIDRQTDRDRSTDGTTRRCPLYGADPSVMRLVEIIFYTWKLFLHRWKHTPVVFIWDGPVSDEALRDILDFEDVYALRLPPLLNSSLIAGVRLNCC